MKRLIVKKWEKLEAIVMIVASYSALCACAPLAIAIMKDGSFYPKTWWYILVAMMFIAVTLSTIMTILDRSGKILRLQIEFNLQDIINEGHKLSNSNSIREEDKNGSN